MAQLAGITVRWHGHFAYVNGQLLDGSTLPLFRLRYADSAATWGFAIYRASHDDYENSILPAATQPAPRRKPSTAHAASPRRPHRLALY